MSNFYHWNQDKIDRLDEIKTLLDFFLKYPNTYSDEIWYLKKEQKELQQDLYYNYEDYKNGDKIL